MEKTKVCRVCGQEFLLTEEYFYKRKGSKDGFRNDCRTCSRKRRKQNRLDNIDKNREYDRQYNLVHKEAKDQREKQRYQDNKEAISQRNKQYAQSEHGSMVTKIIKQRRRTRKKQLPATLTGEQWQIIKECFNNTCAYCGTDTKLTLDHFIPVSKLGELSLNNAIPVCGSCNSLKGTKDFFDWYPRQPFYSKKREKAILNFLGYANQDTQQPMLLI